MSTAPPSAGTARDSLHGVTLEALVGALVARYGWAGLGERIPVRCFLVDPSIPSSLSSCAARRGRVRGWRHCTGRD